MQNIQAVELAKAYRLLNHGPTTIVTSAHAGVSNVMAAAWAMPLDFDPPKVLLVIDKSTLTRELVEASGEFALNVPTRAQAEQTLAVGSSSGREGDKFAALDIATFPAQEIGAPLMSGCLAWLECKVIPEPHNEQRYDLFIAEVVAAWADAAAFSEGRWHFPSADQHSLHYLSGGAFFATGEAFNVKLKP
ncbi:flavin reductase family protein [Collimonas pratensis]|uniref:Flavin reductase like domain protein n=1 Tax=Collimonas pratensis TaxID=279113 RepID=A0A127QX15_9BURK|nr:flavin reductase family protein [Collimonas pratensis]AMP05702.1 flavin reductase like domain protein [Collimonas pratensis]AMP14262.1 flavin reductase like domain protein [Collimonas pratensis]